uniref:Uncharacterized protein n=1 Tax=Oryza sativa subsp. japonica TaxID=39947 RepID=Q84ZR2_ORYSJ|nr:hypothetical protein [Oryza sativa Japonica Group]BAD30428.1 hypothetical protein [Oryza sativa Japonica Group]
MGPTCRGRRGWAAEQASSGGSGGRGRRRPPTGAPAVRVKAGPAVRGGPAAGATAAAAGGGSTGRADERGGSGQSGGTKPKECQPRHRLLPAHSRGAAGGGRSRWAVGGATTGGGRSRWAVGGATTGGGRRGESAAREEANLSGRPAGEEAARAGRWE